MKVLLIISQIYLLFAVISPKSAWGAVTFSDAVFPEFATSGRALAMGNAYIAKVDDSSAAFYNPAGLGTVRYPHLHLSNLHIEVNKDWIDLGSGGKITDAFGNFTKGLSLDGTRELLQNNPGNFSHSRFHFAPNFTTRYFSVGYLYSSQTRAAFGTQSGAQFEYAKRTDHGPYASLNLSLFGGILKLGATGTYLTRKEVFGEQDISSFTEPGDSDFQKGTAFVITGGTKFTLPFYALPTLAAKINNATSADFSASTGSAGAPVKVRPSIDLGFSLTPAIGKTTRLHFEINYKDFNNQFSDVSSSRKIGAGFELDFMRSLFFRVGYGDGFGSGGFGLRTRKLEFDFTTYAVDRTSSAFRGNEDRRFVFSLSSGL